MDNRREFLNAVFEFFRVKDENKSLYRSYDITLSKGRNIDWNKLYIKVLEDAETRFLPMPGFFLARFKDCLKTDSKQFVNTGKKVRVYYMNGRYTDYTSCNEGLTLSDIRQKFNGEWEVKEIREYPQTTEWKDDKGKIHNVEVTLVGSQVFPENTPYRVLYARA